MDHLSELPECLIHHILSFLPARDATHTSVLSHAWNQFWLRHPMIDLNSICTTYIYRYCLKLENQEAIRAEERFLIMVDKSLQHRFQQNSNIMTFRMHISAFSSLKSLSPCLDRWICNMVERSVQELDLKVSTSDHPFYYVIPHVLFSAKSLTALSLSRCILDGRSIPDTNVGLPLLRSLCFDGSTLDNDMLQHFISSCASIESLVIRYCKGFKNIRLVPSLHKLNYVEIYTCDDVQNIDVEAPNVGTFSGTLSHKINFVACIALKKLRLIVQKITDEQVQTLLCQAPNLEDLELYHFNLKMIHLKSQSLARLKLLYSRASSVLIQTPNLVSLEYSSFTIPQRVSVSSSKLLNVYMKLWLHLDEPNNLHWVAKLASIVMRSALSTRFKFRVSQENRVLVHDNPSEAFLSSFCDLQDFKQGLVVCITSMDYAVFADYVIHKFYPKTLSVACTSSKPIQFVSEDVMRTQGRVDYYRSAAKLGIYKLILKLKTLKKQWMNRIYPARF